MSQDGTVQPGTAAGTRPTASPGGGDSARSPALRDDAQFPRFAAAGRVSYAGTAITGVVLPILVYRRTGSARQTSLSGSKSRLHL